MRQDSRDASTCASPPARKPWQKVLWREQPGYPDTHTDATFLQSLSVSVQPERDFWRVVRGSAAVTQQMSTAAIACAAANYLLEVRQSANVNVFPSCSSVGVCSVSDLSSRPHTWVCDRNINVPPGAPRVGSSPSVCLMLTTHAVLFCSMVSPACSGHTQEHIAARKLLQYDAALILVLGLGCLLGGARPPPRLLLRGLRQCALLMTGVYLLSPLLQVCWTSRLPYERPQRLDSHIQDMERLAMRRNDTCEEEIHGFELQVAVNFSVSDGCGFLAAVHCMVVLMQTLTRTISTDTIVATTAYLLLLHLYLHDYNFVNNVTDKLTGSVSLGAAVFASVLLASRLRSQEQVFTQARMHTRLAA